MCREKEGKDLDLLCSDLWTTDPQQVRSVSWWVCIEAASLRTHLPVNNLFNLMSQPIGEKHIDKLQNTPSRGSQLQVPDKLHLKNSILLLWMPLSPHHHHLHHHHHHHHQWSMGRNLVEELMSVIGEVISCKDKPLFPHCKTAPSLNGL